MYVCMYTNMHIESVCMYACMYVYILMCVCVCVCTEREREREREWCPANDERMYACVSVYYTNIYIYIYIYVYKCIYRGRGALPTTSACLHVCMYIY
jgi:hypothetical protein